MTRTSGSAGWAGARLGLMPRANTEFDSPARNFFRVTAMPDTASHVTVFFDGLCEPLNPGGTGCYGYTIRGLGGPLDVVPGSGVLADDKEMTNNVAEYVALGKALSYLVANAKDRIGPETVLVICGDSKLVVEQVKGAWRCEAPKLVVLRERVAEHLARLGCKVRLEWIPREQNVEADFLSRAAFVGRTGKPVPERTKEK